MPYSDNYNQLSIDRLPFDNLPHLAFISVDVTLTQGASTRLDLWLRALFQLAAKLLFVADRPSEADPGFNRNRPAYSILNSGSECTFVLTFPA